MSVSGEDRPGRMTGRARAWQAAGLLGLVVFAVFVGRFHEPTNGFTSLLLFGSELEATQVPELNRVPHYVYDDVIGYDGAYYVQIALHPLLRDPAVKAAIDNPQYRARRILLPWAAWVLGAGQPQWVVHIFPLLNVGCWFALALLLWRWLPPDGAENLLRWAGVMFSHGLCASVRNSLVDGPALLLVAVGMALWEKNRRAGAMGALAAAALTRETSLLAGTMLAAPPAAGWRWWARNAAVAAVIGAPLLGWIGYVHFRFGPALDPGVRNFAWPFAGLAEKWASVWWNAGGVDWLTASLFNVLCVAGLTVQLLFFASRWQPGNAWWRIGATFAALMLLLAQPVWEGYPGAATRVLLPMTLAFNVLLPRGGRWLPVLVAGNLSLVAGLAELDSPPREMIVIRGDPPAVAACRAEWKSGWYQMEWSSARTWRWCRQRAALQVNNRSGGTLRASLALDLWGITPRTVRITLNGAPLATVEVGDDAAGYDLGSLTLRPGENLLVFESDQPPASSLNEDPRLLNFAVSEIAITVAPAAPAPPR